MLFLLCLVMVILYCFEWTGTPTWGWEGRFALVISQIAPFATMSFHCILSVYWLRLGVILRRTAAQPVTLSSPTPEDP